MPQRCTHTEPDGPQASDTNIKPAGHNTHAIRDSTIEILTLTTQTKSYLQIAGTYCLVRAGKEIKYTIKYQWNSFEWENMIGIVLFGVISVGGTRANRRNKHWSTAQFTNRYTNIQ